MALLPGSEYEATDRAYHVLSCFEWSVLRGITLVPPYRSFGGGAATARRRCTATGTACRTAAAVARAPTR